MPNATKYLCYSTTILCALLVSSCHLLDAEEALGQGYYFVDAGKTSTIILAIHVPPHGSGIPVLPYPVVAYGFNEDYIAAIATDQHTKRRTFWLIDKRKKASLLKHSAAQADSASWVRYDNVVGPLDSVAYATYVNAHPMQIKLIKNRWYTPQALKE